MFAAEERRKRRAGSDTRPVRLLGGVSDPTIETAAADRAMAAELLATLKAAAEAVGFKVQPRPDAAFAPAYVELPEPLRVEVCPDCGLTFFVRLDWHAAQAERRAVVYCPAGHMIDLAKPVPFDPTRATVRELLARLRAAETDNQRLRNALDRVPRLASRPPDAAELERRFKWLANHAHRTAYGQGACHFCGKQFKDQTSGVRHLKAYHVGETAALPVEHFDAP